MGAGFFAPSPTLRIYAAVALAARKIQPLFFESGQSAGPISRNESHRIRPELTASFDFATVDSGLASRADIEFSSAVFLKIGSTRAIHLPIIPMDSRRPKLFFRVRRVGCVRGI